MVVFCLGKGEASTVYKDFLVYYAVVNKLQKKELPPLYAFNCDDPANQGLCQQYGISEFPTTIVFSPDGTAQSTVVGASYEMIEGLIQVQRKLVNGEDKAVQMVCSLIISVELLLWKSIPRD